MTEQTANDLQRIFGAEEVPEKVLEAVSTFEFAMNRLQYTMRPEYIVTAVMLSTSPWEWKIFGKPNETPEQLREQMGYEAEPDKKPAPKSTPKPAPKEEPEPAPAAPVLSSQADQEPMVVTFDAENDEASDDEMDAALKAGMENMQKDQNGERPEPPERPKRPVPKGMLRTIEGIESWAKIGSGTEIIAKIKNRKYPGEFLGVSNKKAKTLRVTLKDDPRNRAERKLHMKAVALA